MHFTGFAEGLAGIRRARLSYAKAEKRALERLGKRAIEFLKRSIADGSFSLVPKRRPDGKPTLVRTGRYLKSWRSTVDGRTLGIGPTGSHGDGLTNEALGDLLEYGAGDIPARPHQRPTALFLEREAGAVGKEIEDAIAGSL
jgi:hypothetical protein